MRGRSPAMNPYKNCFNPSQNEQSRGVQQAESMENTIVYLIGFPGTGKYTIAKELCAMQPNIRLVDNHLINNPLFSLIPLNGKTKIPQRVWDNQGMIWDAVIDVMTHVSPSEFSFVLTNYLSQNNPSDVEWFKTVEKMSEKRQARFIPVHLTIDLEEHKKRISSEGRAEQYKMTDQTAPETYRSQDKIVDITHQNALNLDVTHLSARGAAKKILSFAARK